MKITLDPAIEQRVEQKLKDGKYANPAEVLSAAMDALAQQEAYDAAVADLRAKIAVGIAEADRGQLSDGEEFFAELDRELAADGDPNTKIA